MTTIDGPEVVIAAQHPVNTVEAIEAFWRMLQQQKVTTIDLTEEGEPKTFSYCPVECGKSKIFGDIKVTLSSKTGCMFTYYVEDQASEMESEINRIHYSLMKNKSNIDPETLSTFVKGLDGHNRVCIHCQGGRNRTINLVCAINLRTLIRGDFSEFKCNPEGLKKRLVDEVINRARKERGADVLKKPHHREALENLFEYWKKKPSELFESPKTQFYYDQHFV